MGTETLEKTSRPIAPFPEEFSTQSTPPILEYDEEVLLVRAKCLDQIAEHCDVHFCVLKEMLRSNGKQPYEGFCQSCSKGSVWCPTKQAILYSAMGLDALLQMRAQYDLKYIESSNLGADVGKDGALQDWISYCTGKFRELFNQGVRNPETILQRCVLPAVDQAVEKRRNGSVSHFGSPRTQAA
jgi:hypothetical protein